MTNKIETFNYVKNSNVPLSFYITAHKNQPNDSVTYIKLLYKLHIELVKLGAASSATYLFPFGMFDINHEMSLDNVAARVLHYTILGDLTYQYARTKDNTIQALFTAACQRAGLPSNDILDFKGVVIEGSVFEKLLTDSKIPVQSFEIIKKGATVTATKRVSTGIQSIVTVAEQKNKAIAKAILSKPDSFYIDDTKWRFLTERLADNNNIILKGPSGAGKSSLAELLSEAMNRPCYVFNMAEALDARAYLMGQTTLVEGGKTAFQKSFFLEAIQTPNAVVVLDELNRAGIEALNILLAVLNTETRQRKIRVDELNQIIEVHSSVCFVGTVNEGRQFSGTKKLDEALENRFTVSCRVNLPPLQAEVQILKQLYWSVKLEDIMSICQIAAETRHEAQQQFGRLKRQLSVRQTRQWAAICASNTYTTAKAAELLFEGYFSNEGDLESEWIYFLQIVQKHTRARL
jgi:MoxR-like ATPase